MKKYLFLLLIGAASLTACGDDDDPVVPELNKLTKVSCYKDGASSPLFTADINYTSDGKISNINLGVDKLLFIYSDGKFSVTGIHSGEVIEEYTLSGNVITSKKISQENPYASNEIYVSDEYSYRYSGLLGMPVGRKSLGRDTRREVIRSTRNIHGRTATWFYMPSHWIAGR